MATPRWHSIINYTLHSISLVSLLWVSYTFGFYVHMWAFVMMKKSRWYLWAHLLNCREEAMYFQPCAGNKTELLIPDGNNIKIIILWTWKASDVLLSTQVWNNTRLTRQSQTYLSGLKIVLHTMLEAFAFWFEGCYDQAVAHKMGRVPDAFAGTKAVITNFFLKKSSIFKTQYFKHKKYNFKCLLLLNKRLAWSQ